MAAVRELEFVRATKDDYATITAILDEAAAWQIAHGIRDQWRPGIFSWDWIGGPIERGWTYVVRRGGDPVGTVSLEAFDREIWDRGQQKDALFVHRLAVAGSERGHGVGSAILGWCGEQVRADARRYLRLDCPFSNAKLRAYYEGLGFDYRGDKTLSGDWGSYHAARYEKAVA